MTSILKLTHDDEERELEFDLSYQLSLSTQERFEMMFQKSKELKEIMLRNGHRKTFEIIKRT